MISDIDYAAIMQHAPTDRVDDIGVYLSRIMEDIWCDAYRDMCERPTGILGFDWSGFHYWFDYVSQLQEDELPQTDELIEDRIVVVYGFSHPEEVVKRDTSRQRGFPLTIRRGDGTVKYDKGHFLGHTLGGGLDANLFPQRRDVNRGWSERGKVFRSMERYCQEHPGTFCFSRPIYDDQSWHPAVLEYGLLREDGTLWVEQFEN